MPQEKKTFKAHTVSSIKIPMSNDKRESNVLICKPALEEEHSPNPPSTSASDTP